jgi:hypothetical protein
MCHQILYFICFWFLENNLHVAPQQRAGNHLVNRIGGYAYITVGQDVTAMRFPSSMVVTEPAVVCFSSRSQRRPHPSRSGTSAALSALSYSQATMGFYSGLAGLGRGATIWSGSGIADTSPAVGRPRAAHLQPLLLLEAGLGGLHPALQLQPRAVPAGTPLLLQGPTLALHPAWRRPGWGTGDSPGRDLLGGSRNAGDAAREGAPGHQRRRGGLTLTMPCALPVFHIRNRRHISRSSGSTKSVPVCANWWNHIEYDAQVGHNSAACNTHTKQNTLCTTDLGANKRSRKRAQMSSGPEMPM